MVISGLAVLVTVSTYPVDRGRVLVGLTRQAAASARGGDCATIVRIAATVEQIDAAFHATVFVHDPVIARCLAASTTAPTSSAPPAP
jgi:hypothetical protein